MDDSGSEDYVSARP
jgi:hypothetical protein